MLTGDNGILQKATTAKENTDRAQIEERIKMAYHSALTEGQGSYTKESLEDELKKEFGENNYNVDDSDDTNWKMIAHGQEVTIPAGEKERNKTFKSYNLGDEVIVNGEHFFVINDSDETNSTVRVLSQKCINPVNLTQLVDQNNLAIEFSTKNYWVDDSDHLLSKYGNSYPADLTIDKNINEEEGQEKKALYISQQYGKKLGAEEANLLKVEDVENLKSTEYEWILTYFDEEDYTELSYWLGVASGAEMCYYWMGTYSSLESCSYNTTGYGAAVRPVLTFSKSKIS